MLGLSGACSDGKHDIVTAIFSANEFSQPYLVRFPIRNLMVFTAVQRLLTPCASLVVRAYRSTVTAILQHFP